MSILQIKNTIINYINVHRIQSNNICPLWCKWYSTKHHFEWWIYSGMLIGALKVHPTFYPAVQKLKAALYLLNQYSYYISLTYLYKIVTKTL